MLIDSSHKRWILITALIAVAALIGHAIMDHRYPGGLTGSTTVGLWFGVIGSLLMIFAGLLAAHRKLLRWSWLGSRKFWLKGHIWLGLLSLVFILCHSNYRWGGPIEKVLWTVLLLTLATGIWGLWLQQFLPRLITARVPNEAPYEQIPHLCQMMRRKADALVDQTCKAEPAKPEHVQLQPGASASLLEFYEQVIRPFLHHPCAKSLPLVHPLQAEALFAKVRTLPGLSTASETLNLLESLCTERRQLLEQERLHHWLHGWLLIHVPLSIALLVIGLAHAFFALYY